MGVMEEAVEDGIGDASAELLPEVAVGCEVLGALLPQELQRMPEPQMRTSW